MGEVYRADDLKLGHSVALKFLPTALAQDPRLLQNFHVEVRNSRQVSHPNVCRVYDIGEFQGLTFLTMEYIDGEDLASLLRRIGRLPPDKAVEIAHQICAGLAAAHDAGLLHRDLKPANVMLDGRGRARITDFGLAVGTEDLGGRQQFAGTPAYMAPEQRKGAPASVKTDIYSLGLVLFEIFTGKRAFEDNNLAVWREPEPGSVRQDRPKSTQPRTPASSSNLSLIDIDPMVKRAILRCLEDDPAQRPASAAQVAAALPGGDPLAAALAAGETPSPEMVAAAGEEVAVSVRGATVLLIAIIALLGLLVPLSRFGTFIGLAPAVKPREVLEARAQDIAAQAGYSQTEGDHYGSFSVPQSYAQWREQTDPDWYRNLHSVVPDPYRYSFRTAPGPLIAFNPYNNPSQGDPPLTLTGMTATVVDGSGRLISFRSVPPFFDKDLPQPAQTDWAAFFKVGGWNYSDFKTAEPSQLPNVAYDARLAWDGTVSGTPLHVEAASLRGRPISFTVNGPWLRQTPPSGGSSLISQIVFTVTFLFILPVIGGIFARRNIRLGRGDPQGATRLSIVVVFVIAINTLLAQHWVWHPGILQAVTANVGLALMFAVVGWVSYVALEPLLRREVPHLLISWTRLLAGRFTDGRVGRDVLIGALAGVVVGDIHMAVIAMPFWFHFHGVAPYPGISTFNTPGSFTGSLFGQIWVALLIPLSIGFSYGFLRRRIHNPWIAGIILYLLVWPMSFNSEGTFVQLVVGAIGTLLFVGVFLRFGLLALAAELYVENILFFYPPVLRADAWYFNRSLIVFLLLIAIAVYAYRCALAGRHLFSLPDEV